MKATWKPATLLAPLPAVMVSCGTMENPNILTIAWTGIVNTNPPMTYISVRPERHSYAILKETKEFVINLPTEALLKALDFCGVKSGAECNKFEQMQLTPEPATQVQCPMIAQSPINIECRIKQIMPLGSHDMMLAEIVAVNVDHSAVDKTGKLCIEKCGLLTFAHGQYFTLGKSVGTFGFSVRKKPLRSQTAKKVKSDEPNHKGQNKKRPRNK